MFETIEFKKFKLIINCKKMLFKFTIILYWNLNAELLSVEVESLELMISLNSEEKKQQKDNVFTVMNEKLQKLHKFS